MRNNKKICALLILMMMGTFTVVRNAVYASEESSVVETVSEQKEIKGNKEAIDTAQELINSKDFNGALAYLDAYISSKPKKYEGYKLRGDVYYALRRYDLAEKDYQAAINLKAEDDKFITNTKVITAAVLGVDKNEQRQNPELGNLYAGLMYAQMAQNNSAYEVSYAKAVEFNSHIYLPQPKKDEISQINCPQKYRKVFNPQGDDKFLYGAIEDIEKENYRDSIFKSQYIISNYPDYYLGYYLNGVALAGLEQDEDAIVSFKKSLEKNAYDFEALASLGQIYYSKAEKSFSSDDAKSSNEYFHKALTLNPNCNSYYFYIGLNELQLGNINLAIEDFNRAIKLKPNDYNSLYYKLIAQYIKGDYSEVAEGSTNLLYKHVSNYNSVLYLRALAYYKTEAYELALNDLEKIYNNTNDIYNADIRYVSPKEQTLISYVYYLKAQILNKQGQGVKSDIARAYQNPIIAKLAGVEQVIKPYQKDMSGETVTVDSYTKFSNAYRAVPALLQANLRISEEDIENQYDYIRTTFDDIGVSFVYNNPYYQMIAIDNYVEKKYSSKLPVKNEEKITEAAGPELRPKEENVPALKAHTPQSEMIVSENSTSIAQMLAAQSLLSEPKNVIDENSTNSEDVIASVQEDVSIPSKPAEEKAEDVQSTAEVTIEEASDQAEEVKVSVETTSENSEEIVEITEVEKVEEVSDNIDEDIIDSEVLETTTEVQEEAASEQKVSEKHAEVNYSEFNIATAKPLPVIENPEDIVELEPQSFMFKAKQQIPAESFEIKYPTTIQDDFSGMKITQENPSSEQGNDQMADDERIILPETDEEKTTHTKDESVAVPIVLVPEIGTPIVNAIENTIETEQEVELNSVEAEKIEIPQETIADAEKPAKAAKVKKQKAKKQRVEKLENEKPAKVKKEKPLKEQAEKPIRDKKKVKEKKVKAEKEENLTEAEQAIHSIVAETFGTTTNTVASEKPAKEVKQKVEKIKKEKPVKEVKPKKEKTKKIKESNVSTEQPTASEVEVNLNLSETSDDVQQPKKKKKKKFNWWFKKDDVEKQNHSKALNKLFEKQSGDTGEVFVKNDKDKKIIKTLDNK